MLVLVLGDQSCLESENILVISKELNHVFFGRLRLQTEHATQRVFRSSVPVKRWDRMFYSCLLTLLDC